MWKSISQVLADQFGAYYNIKRKKQSSWWRSK